MAWQHRSARRARLPSNWPSLVPFIIKRDNEMCCIKKNDRCTQLATEVDHIRPGDDHRPSNLQAACHACHAWKTALEGVAARPAARRAGPTHPAHANRTPTGPPRPPGSAEYRLA